MSIKLMNPNGIFEADVYSQVAIAIGTKTIYISGQVAQDAQGNL